MAGIKDISDLIKDTPRDIDPGFSIDPFEHLSPEEKERLAERFKRMSEDFSIDPTEGMSEEEKEEYFKMWERFRKHRERSRERMGLPEGIQLLNQGGMMDINRMTAPLGYDNGGDVNLAAIMADMKASRGPAKVTHPIQKIISDRSLIDPYSVSQGERLKELGSKGLEGIRSLFGAKEAGAGEALDELISKRAMLIGQINGEMMFGDDETLKNLMDEYKRLDNMIRTIQIGE